MAWAILIVAGIFEVALAIGLKYTEGVTRLWPSVWVVATMAVSLWLLGLAMRSLPVGTAYSVWVGVGADRPHAGISKRVHLSSVCRRP